MSRRSIASTPLSPDDLPDLPDIGEHSEDSSDSVRAAAVTSSYSEICLNVEDELNDDLLPGEIQDLDVVHDATEEITRLVDQINRGEDDHQLSASVGAAERKERHVPTSLGVGELKVLPTASEAAFQGDGASIAQQRPMVGDRSNRAAIDDGGTLCQTTDHVPTPPLDSSDSPAANQRANSTTPTSVATCERHLNAKNSTEAPSRDRLEAVQPAEDDLIVVAEEATEDGPMVAATGNIAATGQDVYVADDINEKIRQAASRNASLAPTPIPDVSRLPVILAELEGDARTLANSVQHMMETLSRQLHNVSHLTSGYISAYENGVLRTCDTADGNVKSMYRLLAKYEELSNAMQPVHRVADEVRKTRQLVGQLEGLVDIKKHRMS